LKIENRPYIWHGSTDIREIWHGDAYWASEPEVEISNFQDEQIKITENL